MRNHVTNGRRVRLTTFIFYAGQRHGWMKANENETTTFFCYYSIAAIKRKVVLLLAKLKTTDL